MLKFHSSPRPPTALLPAPLHDYSVPYPRGKSLRFVLAGVDAIGDVALVGGETEAHTVSSAASVGSAQEEGRGTAEQTGLGPGSGAYGEGSATSGVVGGSDLQRPDLIRRSSSITSNLSSRASDAGLAVRRS